MNLARAIPDFVEGFLFLPRGVSYLASNKKLWPYAALPLLLNVVIMLGLAVAAYFFFPDIRAVMWDRPDSWLLLPFWYAFTVLLGLGLVIAIFILFLILLSIIAGPFNSKLCLHTLEALRGEKLHPAGGLYVDLLLPVLNEIKKLVLFTLLQGCALILNFLPLIGSVGYFIVSSGLTFLLLAYAFLEYALETEPQVSNLRRRLGYLEKHLFSAMGFGFALSILFFIPVLDLFLGPGAVVGAAMLYHRLGPNELAP
jgi:CysZ protein